MSDHDEISVGYSNSAWIRNITNIVIEVFCSNSKTEGEEREKIKSTLIDVTDRDVGSALQAAFNAGRTFQKRNPDMEIF